MANVTDTWGTWSDVVTVKPTTLGPGDDHHVCGYRRRGVLTPDDEA